MKELKNVLSRKYVNLLLTMLVLPVAVRAQENTEAKPAPAPKEYVKATFENGVMINNQTVEAPGKKTLDFMIQHRFGVIENAKDLYGIFAPSNIRLGLNYGITKRISLGLGITKNKMQYDLNGKVIIFRQAKKKGMPVSITYFGCVARSTKEKENFLNQEGKFKETNKLTYFHELMIARKINRRISLQAGFTYAYINILDSLYGQHDFYGASFVGRYKFSPQSTIAVDFDYPLNVTGINETVKPLPNLSLGYELSTGSHQFQVFVTTGSSILDQDSRVLNTNDFTDRKVLIGFNITRQWGFKK